MKNIVKPNCALFIACVSALFLLGFSGCHRPSPVLLGENSTGVRIDTVFPNTPEGVLAREHLAVAMGHGEDAEAKYQESLTKLRANPAIATTLYDAYRNLSAENYFYRNMIVESLKELRAPQALGFLTEIAREKIPPDRNPENLEIDTREDEIVIRITAVEGISILAAAGHAEATRALVELIGNEDLTVRQMAARGYLNSSFGDTSEKIRELQKLLPKEEHWYITRDTTDIRKVAHPEMPEKFDIRTEKSNSTPKIKQ